MGIGHFGAGTGHAMGRLDRHVTMVQSKLTLERFFAALGYCIVIFFAAVLLVVLVDRFIGVAPPRAVIWFWSALGVAAVAAFVLAMIHKPTAHQAAVFIDERLGLNEKFSTALFARQQAGKGDPFAMAAIRDAERTADNVSLHKRFPLEFPRSGYWAVLAALVVLPMLLWLPRFDLFGREAKLELAKRQALQRTTAQHEAEKVLTAISSLPKAIQGQANAELAKRDLKRALEQNTTDTAELKMTAEHAQEEAEQAKLEEMKSSQAFAQDLTDKAVFNSLNPAADDHSTVADASREIASGNFSKAAATLTSMPDKFNAMSDEEKKKVADQMADMARQLSSIAKDPAAMAKLQQQLQQQGATKQQAQQIAKTAQQAAQGNPQAQQQLQQMQQQLQQQMNGGKGPTAQQQSAIAKAMQQMQSVASSQSSAQQMAQAAQQMSQGMQQSQAAQSGSQKGAMQQASAKQGGQQPGAQKSGGQQTAGGQKQGGAQQASAGQKSGSQQASGGQQAGAGKQPGGNQPGGQQANGGGQSGQGHGQQQMKQAGQQMADALDKMDATKKDAEQQVAEGDGANDANSQGENNPSDGGTGEFKQGNPAGHKGQGMGGPGIGQGGVGQKQIAAFTVKQEKDPSQNIANGKILAKTFVKADQLIGKSTIQLSSAAKAAVKESTDDVDGDNEVPKDAQKMVKDYFNTMDTGPQ
jgi:hypothetical protein